MPISRSISTRRISVLAIGAAIAAAAGTAIPAAAQDSQRATGLEEIVVTAQRREESLQNTPIAITAFTADKLSNLGVFGVSKIADFAPNVVIQKQPSSNSNMAVVIRGIGITETALTADPKVGMYIDGILVSKAIGGVFDIADMERIEVLRGPQGTLFGRNTTGGAVSVTTQKPSGELRGKATASVGNFGYLRYGGSLDLPAVGNLAAKISYNHSETDGWADNHYTGVPLQPQMPNEKVQKDLASQDNDAYRFALRWTPREDLTFDYAFDKTDNSGVAAPFQILKVKDSVSTGFGHEARDYRMLTGPGGLFDQMAQNVYPRNKRQEHFTSDEETEEYLKIKAHSFIVAWDVSPNLTLKYLLGSRRSRQGNGSALDGGVYYVRDLFYGVYAGNNDPIQTPAFHSRLKNKVEMDSHEFQIIGSAFDDRLHYTGGIFMYEEDVFENNPQTYSLPIAFVAPNGAFSDPLGPLYDAAGFCPAMYGGYLCVGSQRLPIPGDDPGAPGVVDFAYGQNARSRAVYGQATYALTDALGLTLGIRYTEDDKKAWLFNQNIVRAIPTHSRNNPVRGKGDWDNVSYLANLNYAFNDDIRAYLTYATGYNGGGFGARAASAEEFRTPYDEEEIKSIELGLKSELLDNRLRLNVALFRNEYTDAQVSVFKAGSGGASASTVNAGEETIQGIEFDVVAVPVDGLTIDFTYGYLDAKFDEYMSYNASTGRLENIARNTKVPEAPKNSASLGVQYDFEPFSFGVLSARVDVAYKDSFVYHPYENEWNSPDSRTLVNARISLNDIRLGGCCSDSNKLRVSLWGKNLTDQEYINWGIDFGALGWSGAVFGEPRTYGLDVVYSYD